MSGQGRTGRAADLPLALVRPTTGKVGRPGRAVTTELDETLLSRALAALRESDYNEVSLSRLADRIGVSKPTLYRRFGSKDGLVAAMVEAEFSRLMASPPPEARPHDDALESLRGYARDLFDVLIRPGTANFVRFQNQEGVDSPRLAQLRRTIHLALLDNLAAVIARVQAAEGLAPTDAHMLAALLVAQLQSPATLYALGFSQDEILRGYSPDAYFDWRFSAFLAALRARSAAVAKA